MAIYLDHASTTPIDPDIARLIADSLQQPWANPASQHAAGRRARAVLEDAKDRIKTACVGSDSTTYQQWQAWQLVLTSGGTEANNLALHGLASDPAAVFVGATEHPSILVPVQQSPQLAGRARAIPIDPSSLTPNIDVLDQWLGQARHTSHAPLVSLMVGNNETGLLNNIAQISEVCRKHGAVLHTDAVQALGKLNISQLLPWVDALSFSAHKLNGPVGVGALMFRTSLALRPMFFGGGQQLELRPGTESVVAAVALATAVEKAELFRTSGGDQRLTEHRDLFERLLNQRVPQAHIIGQALPRLPHISSVAFPGWDRQGLLMKFDLAGLECSSGSACASGSSQPSHVLLAMNLPDEWIRGTIRFSFGRTTTVAEIEQAVAIIADSLARGPGWRSEPPWGRPCNRRLNAEK